MCISSGTRQNGGFLAGVLPEDSTRGIALLSIVYLGVLALTLVIDSTQNFLAQWTGQMAMADLRRKLLKHLHQLPVSYYDVTPAGRLVTRLTTDIEALNDLFANGIVASAGQCGDDTVLSCRNGSH
jgi:ATP-binding cassette subfamily B multidrug efflux pump